jgi:peptide/nickel transport system substrate-binding protein
MSTALAILIGLSVVVSIMSGLIINAYAQLPQGVPREQTLILDMAHRMPNPDNFNAWVPGVAHHRGLNIGVLDTFWYANTTDGSLVPALADGLPEFSDDYTVMKVKLKRGIYWSDGVEFTADDVVYTLTTLAKYPGFAANALVSTWVKNAYALDKYSVVIELNEPNPMFFLYFTVQMYGASLYIMPKHIFEAVEKRGEDPTKFNFNPPVSLGPYTLVAFDTGGYWFLWRLRDDWERTALGIWVKEHGLGTPPKYLLHRAWDNVQQYIVAMCRYEIDWVLVIQDPEAWDSLKKCGYPVIRAWDAGWPYAWVYESNNYFVAFNNAKWPYTITGVRWALALAINMTDVMITGFGGTEMMVPILITPIYTAVKDIHIKAFNEWLNDFELTLPDGSKFRAFDSEAPLRIVRWAIAQGYIDEMPSKEDIMLRWGVGWWKYAPDVAEQLLKAQGFSRGPDGKWRLPDGRTWSIEINYPPYELAATRLAQGVAEWWRRFGIDVSLNGLEATLFWDNNLYGRFDVSLGWGSFVRPILGGTMQAFDVVRSQFAKPIGNYSSNWYRISDSELDSLILKGLSVSPFDPKSTEHLMLTVRKFTEQMYLVPLGAQIKFVPFSEKYWTGFPSRQNNYLEPFFWGAIGRYILPHLKPVSTTPPPPEVVTRVITEVVTTVVAGQTVVQTIERRVEATITKEVRVEVVPEWVTALIIASVIIAVAGVVVGILLRRKKTKLG